jgi:PleD family two-component response regulator
MENERLVIFERQISKITLSIGIAEYVRNEEMGQFIHRADVNMYQAKQSGGNKVFIMPIACEVSKDLRISEN